MTLLTGQIGVGIELIMVRLTRSISVTAFALSVLATGNGTVTGSTANFRTGYIIEANIIVVLQQRAASSPEVSIVTGGTAIGRGQSFVTNRAIEALINPNHVVVLITGITGAPADRTVTIFTTVDISTGSVTEAATHTELHHVMVWLTSITGNMTAITIGNR
jgi:hypothetical protein